MVLSFLHPSLSTNRTVFLLFFFLNYNSFEGGETKGVLITFPPFCNNNYIHSVYSCCIIYRYEHVIKKTKTSEQLCSLFCGSPKMMMLVLSRFLRKQGLPDSVIPDHSYINTLHEENKNDFYRLLAFAPTRDPFTVECQTRRMAISRPK